MPDPDAEQRSFTDWLRHSARYIHEHRGRTFVVAMGGETVADANFHRIVYDLAVLQGLGIRLVLVHGTRPQIDAELSRRGIESRFVNGLRVTTPEVLECVRSAVGTTRVEIESKLSMGQPDSPMSGARVRVACGNFVTARPVGIRDGEDHWYTGEVRRVDAEAISDRLHDSAVVLVSNLGYSWTGEVFNLSVQELAAHVAVAVDAHKLVCLTDDGAVVDSDGLQLRELAPENIPGLSVDSEQGRWLRAAGHACDGGVPRVHLVSRHEDGALLRELFTRDGAGTLITSECFEGMRPAELSDLPAVLELIRPLEEAGVLVPRSRERIEREISHFFVVERDESVVACAALYSWSDGRQGEVCCFAVHPDYRNGGQGKRLLSALEQRAVEQGMVELFVLTTRTAHWFHEQGFEPARLQDLEPARQSLYSPTRNSKVYRKMV